eukprot:scaffold2059_cov190-Amphora_coffeaeformis.AAC.5
MDVFILSSIYFSSRSSYDYHPIFWIGNLGRFAKVTKSFPPSKSVWYSLSILPSAGHLPVDPFPQKKERRPCWKLNCHLSQFELPRVFPSGRNVPAPFEQEDVVK